MLSAKEKAALYPKDWKEVSRWIRFERAGTRCECEGECGLHKTNPGPRRCNEHLGKKAQWSKGKVVLSVAHLNAENGPCKCEPLCSKPEHLKAMCSRCHLRYDLPLHKKNARTTRSRKRREAHAKAGQAELF